MSLCSSWPGRRPPPCLLWSGAAGSGQTWWNEDSGIEMSTCTVMRGGGEDSCELVQQQYLVLAFPQPLWAGPECAGNPQRSSRRKRLIHLLILLCCMSHHRNAGKLYLWKKQLAALELCNSMDRGTIPAEYSDAREHSDPQHSYEHPCIQTNLIQIISFFQNIVNWGSIFFQRCLELPSHIILILVNSAFRHFWTLFSFYMKTNICIFTFSVQIVGLVIRRLQDAFHLELFFVFQKWWNPLQWSCGDLQTSLFSLLLGRDANATSDPLRHSEAPSSCVSVWQSISHLRLHVHLYPWPLSGGTWRSTRPMRHLRTLIPTSTLTLVLS